MWNPVNHMGSTPNLVGYILYLWEKHEFQLKERELKSVSESALQALFHGQYVMDITIANLIDVNVKSPSYV